MKPIARPTAINPDAHASESDGAFKRLTDAAAVAFVSLSLLISPAAVAPVWANNVRLQDVESPELKEGLVAATSGQFTKAEMVGGLHIHRLSPDARRKASAKG